MKKTCPDCGKTLIEETYVSGYQGSGSQNYSGSIDYHVVGVSGGSMDTRVKVKTIYRCPDSNCGFLSIDC